MCAKQVKQAQREVETTGHSWDGIEEFNNPLPRWWVWVLYLTIIWGIGYTIAYPAWPLITGHTQGVIGSNQRADVEADIKRFDDANAGIKAKLVAADLASIPANDELKTFAVSAGASVFKNNCAQCHGSGAAGVQGKGYPNLLDNDWLWGGDMEAIHTTVTHGIRNTTDEDARLSQMPAFGVDGILEKPQIAQVVQYVRQISGQDHDAAQATEGAAVFAENCVACHGEDGKGNREFGAPNLTDAIWLYGGDVATLTETVTKARYGVMPAWTGKLSEDEIRAVATYVHSLGGGE
ncbi:MAG: cytochrome-c oxidase, cbb3-type subunit III [Pseudorhodobacter sp. PARRP1]|nr:MAG: cytochrome-c oxidase, cbb3-type subunit III [Pseudorhodobacter sp. PARRP1]